MKFRALVRISKMSERRGAGISRNSHRLSAFLLGLGQPCFRSNKYLVSSKFELQQLKSLLTFLPLGKGNTLCCFGLKIQSTILVLLSRKIQFWPNSVQHRKRNLTQEIPPLLSLSITACCATGLTDHILKINRNLSHNASNSSQS